MSRCVWVVLFACFGVSCAKKTPGGPPESCKGVPAALSAVAYNLANGPGMVRWAPERVEPTIGELSKLDADVMCLVEVWRPETRDGIAAALGVPGDQIMHLDTGEDAYGGRIGETGQDRCDAADLEEISACAQKTCKDVRPSEVSFCVREKCGMPLSSLHQRTKDDQSCLRCIGAVAGKSVAEAKRICLGAGASRIQDGNNGAMLVSRFPLENKEYFVLPSSNSNRVALFATVVLPKDAGRIEVACVHLAAGGNGILSKPWHSGYGSWPEEKRKQYELTADILKRRAARTGRTALLMGDLNAGPGISKGRYRAKGADELWMQILDDGFESPTLGTVPAVCTGSCPGNKTDDSVASGNEGGDLIDHVLILPPADKEKHPVLLESVCSDSVMTGTFPFKGDPKRAELSFSDHYGVRVKFALRPN